MSELFIGIYRFFSHHRWIFFLLLTLMVGFIFLFGSKISLEEDISKVSSGNNSLNRYEYVIRNFKFADKLIVHLIQKDTIAEANPELLISAARDLRSSLLSTLDSSYIKKIFLQFDDSLYDGIQNIINKHLPLFLSDTDYKAIDSLMHETPIGSLLRSNFKILVSPASLVLQQRILTDPLGITMMAFNKFRSLQSDNHYILYNGCVFSQDKRHLLMFITPANSSSETKKNSRLVSYLNKYTHSLDSSHATPINVEFYGYAATGVGNANQVKKDIILTLCIAIILIFLLIGWYFRNILIPLLGFVPAFFGCGFALVILYLIKGSISFIALGLGSVILGLIIDYTLYLVNHYRKKRSVEQVLLEMTHTILICSITTIGVFISLIFLDSSVLHDLGWFTAISVLGASMSSLIILPQFFGKFILPGEKEIVRVTVIDRIGAIDFGKNIWLLTGLGFAGVLSLFVANKVEFERDLNSLNYMSESLKKAERHLDQISNSKIKDVYIVSTGKNLNDALKWNEIIQRKLETLKKQGKIHDFSGISTLLLSDSIQLERLQKWYEFWTPERKSLLLNRLLRKGKQIGFNEKAFSGIKSTLSATFLPITSNQNKALSDILFSDWINETPKMTMISGIAKVADSEKQFVYNAFPENPHLVIFDRQNLTSRFVLTVKHDFELLITLSMVFVSLLLLISLGRIELTVITSLPMFFSWLITLGFMGITGIRFNIFNIIISSFIFGLGVDYSILMMRGLLSQYRTGVNDMKTYQVSILLSSATTLIGVGVLFFTKHPALNSIALISIVGIISVVIISLSYQSMLTQWLLLNPKEKGRYPMTATNILYALFIVWTPILLITLFLVIYSRLINPLLPLQKNRKQEVFHQIFTFLDRIYIKMNFPLHHIIENNAGEAFQKPAIIISNHQSLIEIPALLRLDPKIIILTGNWIYRHWIFGPVARLAGLIPVSESIDDSLSPIKQRIDDGYSLLIFPEGKRSTNGNIQRFHRDAFYIAEKLNQDILPILNYGGGDFLPRGTFWGKPNRLFTEILPRIAPENQIFGNNYSERTKQVRLFYREEYLKFKTRHTTTSYNALNLRLNYLFRGPVLEWYLRVKMTLENNFDSYCDLLPVKGEILDLGCGYGYISYMLMLTSGERIITGVDYDEKKITLAQHGYLKNDRITFIQADVTEFKITSMDGFLFSDVLHYLSYEKQESLLKDCIRNLRPGGVILIREGNADKEKQHKCTKFIKFFSTKILRLNNTHDGMGKFYFTSAQKLIRIAEEYGLTFEIIDQKRITSNNFFIMRMPLKERSSY